MGSRGEPLGPWRTTSCGALENVRTEPPAWERSHGRILATAGHNAITVTIGLAAITANPASPARPAGEAGASGCPAGKGVGPGGRSTNAAHSSGIPAVHGESRAQMPTSTKNQKINGETVHHLRFGLEMIMRLWRPPGS